MRQYITNIHLPADVIFQIFKAYSNVLNTKIDEQSFLLFEIYNQADKKMLEQILLKHSGSTNRRLVSNKLKPLKVVIGYHDYKNSWSIRIFQKNARSIVLSKSFVIGEVRGEFLNLLSSYNNAFKNTNAIRLLNLYVDTEMQHIKNKIFLLNQDDCKVLVMRKDLTSLEEKQIVFTYNYYKALYDKDVSKIDNLSQHNNVLKINDEIKPILDDLIDLINLYGIKLEKGEGDEEKYWKKSF